ncbi:MAG TPA: EamA family transporter [Tepidisphaeraceae bacterium]|jgi:transporter family protein|nr:EamA family transporter [Tepidisphaeraceae bacterium]
MILPLWLILALCSAAAAALVPIFAKIGMKNVDADLVTVLRGIASCVVLLIFGSAIGVWRHVPTVGWRAGAFIALSGIAGAASWIFYFNAIKIGEVSWVAPIDKLSMPIAILLAVLALGERPSGINWAGILLIAAGAYLATLKG